MEYLDKVRANVREALAGIPIIADAIAGKADPKFYARYLTNVWHYAQHSATVIGLAGTRCVLSHPPLAQYLLHHALEELGHEQWALDDLKALGVTEAEVRKSRPVPACASMVGFEYYIAGHGNPVALFGWLYVLEAMGDDLGHIVAKGFKEGLDLPDGVKFLAGHGEADEEHTKDIIEQIETNIKGDDLEDVHYVAGVIADIYTRMFQEIAAGR
jgi:pyrroloquinoline quinone (PQQ) biosynthesis protein C